MTLIPQLMLALLITLTACHCSAQQKTAAAATPAAEAANETITRRMWWNRSTMLEEFNLSVHQRANMDAKFVEHLERERVAREQARKLRREYEEAVGKGHWGKARDLGRELAAAQAKSLEAQLLGRVDVLGNLTADQLQSINSSQPRLLRSNWLGRGGPRRARRAEGRRRAGEERGAQQRSEQKKPEEGSRQESE